MKDLKKGFIVTFLMIVIVIAIVAVYSFNPSPKVDEKPRQFVKIENISITKIIHQSWKNANIPERFKNYSKSWTNECFKDWKYMFWTDEDNRNLVKYHYPWFLNTYDALPTQICRADVSRYFYLLHYGGIYTDLDNECLKPFEKLLANYKLVFGAMKGQYGGTNLKEGYVQNSFMYSVGYHEFWIELILNIKDRVDKRKYARPEGLTGPIILSNAIQDFRSRHKNLPSTEIIIYEPNYFNPFSWRDRSGLNPHCKDFGGMSFEDWQICKKSMIDKGSYVVQYHAHSWG